MGLYTLIVGVLKYFLFLGAFVCFDFYPWGFCPLGLFSVPPPVSHDHMNRNGIVILDCWNINIFFGFLGLFSALIFILGAFGL